MARRRKTGLPATMWKPLFGAVAKYCARHRNPGEAMNLCVKRVWSQFKLPDGRIDIQGLINFLATHGITVPAAAAPVAR